MDVFDIAQQLVAMQQTQITQQLATQALKASTQQDKAIVNLVSQSSIPAAKEGCGTIIDCYA